MSCRPRHPSYPARHSRSPRTSPTRRRRRASWTRALERFGALDILVANAGGPPRARALEVHDEGLVAALNANLQTSIRLALAALPSMRAAGWGRICFLTSNAVKQPIPDLAYSNVARTGLWAWAKTAAQDLIDEGVTVNLVCPGPARHRSRPGARSCGAAGRPRGLRSRGRVPLLRARAVRERRGPPGRRGRYAGSPVTAHGGEPVSESERMHELVERYWDQLLEIEPFLGTSAGDERYDDRLPDPSESGRAPERVRPAAGPRRRRRDRPRGARRCRARHARHPRGGRTQVPDRARAPHRSPDGREPPVGTRPAARRDGLHAADRHARASRSLRGASARHPVVPGGRGRRRPGRDRGRRHVPARGGRACPRAGRAAAGAPRRRLAGARGPGPGRRHAGAVRDDRRRGA